MFYKLGKKLFKFINNSLHFLQILLVFLSFFVILYWVLQMAQISFIQPFAPFFQAIKNIIHLFYHRLITIDDVTVDFSLLVAVFIFLFIVWFLKIFIDWFEFVEKEYDKFFSKLRKKEEAFLNKQLEEENVKRECNNNKFIILIKFYTSNLLLDSFYNRDVTEGVEEKEKEILSDFIKEIKEKIKCEERTIGKNLLLYFDDINDFDDIFSRIDKIILILKEKYRTQNWGLTALVCIDIYEDASKIPIKVKKLETLSQLDLADETVCLASFRQRYLLQKNSRYYIEGKGVYQIESSSEELFCLKSLR